jgi:hypothetical protein
VINKNPATAFDVTLDAVGSHGKPTAMFLTVPKSDIAATDGVTLGNSAISEDGTWQGKWEPVSNTKNGILKLAPSSAVVVKLQ